MTSAAYAALANGASGHAMDYDDTQLSTTPDRTFGLLTHPTIPALVGGAGGRRADRRVGRGVSRGLPDRLRGRVQDRRSDRSGSLRARLPQHRARSARSARPPRPRKLMKLNDAADRAHAGDRVEPVERHPRQLRIDDQAAPRRRAPARTACSPPSWRRGDSPAATTASTASGDSSRCSAAAPISIG